MDRYYGCFGIVKTKMPVREVWAINASSYESAIRQIKKSAQSNYRDRYKEATLFDKDGKVVGWCFRTGGVITYVDRYILTDIGLMPKRK